MKILILMSETGSGHVSAAKALQSALHTRYPGEVEAEVLEVFTSDSLTFWDKVTKLYEPIIVHVPWLWGVVFKSADSQAAINLLVKLAKPTVGRRLKGILEREKPDAVVSVHPLANHITLEALSELEMDIPLFTCMTDLVDSHAGWVANGTDLIIVPTEMAKEGLTAKGAEREKVEVLGLPIHQKFSVPSAGKAALRKAVGLDPDLFLAFMVGGGAGAGGLLERARAISDAKLKLQLVVACGRNVKLREQFLKEQFDIPVTALGYADNVHELMHASDIVISKAGSLTVAEALGVGRPLVLISVLPGQEEGNPILLEEIGAGVKAETPQELVKQLARLIADTGKREEMARAARGIGKPHASAHIAERLYQGVKHRKNNGAR